jgi:hypothetical protein
VEGCDARVKCATLKLEDFFGGVVGAKWRQSGRKGVWRETEEEAPVYVYVEGRE